MESAAMGVTGASDAQRTVGKGLSKPVSGLNFT
jgi:hypothetical protein